MGSDFIPLMLYSCGHKEGDKRNFGVSFGNYPCPKCKAKGMKPVLEMTCKFPVIINNKDDTWKYET